MRISQCCSVSVVEGSSDISQMNFSKSATCLALTVVLHPFFFVLSQIQGAESVYSSHFSKHFIIHPKIIHGREKRHISSTAEKNGYHAEKLVLNYYIDNNLYVIDLKLNKELIPKNAFIEYQSGGKMVTTEITEKEIDLCQYIGKIRGIEESSAAISTCKGINGVIYDGNYTHYIQSGEDESLIAPHFLYKHDDLILNHTCGNENLHSEKLLEIQKKRYKRSNQFTIRGPPNSNKYSRFVELVFVVDNLSYKKIRKTSLSEVYSHCKQLANIMNMMYTPLNIFISLVGIVIWSERDEIEMSADSDKVLENFANYRKNKLYFTHPNDNAQLLTQQIFENTTLGKAFVGSMCTYQSSAAVISDYIDVTGIVAMIAAHELGHSIGMNHDIDNCGCPETKCIMNPTVDGELSMKWSTCSLNYVTEALVQGMDYCLKNKPESLYGKAVCGNGFVEQGEQCDCGLSESCDGNKCCDPTTCMFYHSNVTCATGECCDQKTCQILPAGTTCRGAEYECDLSEYCDGVSEYCPNDIHKIDGTSCAGGDSFCYNGECRTRTDECRLLWGPSSVNGDDRCYNMNTNGIRYGNCGYNPFTRKFSKCQKQDILCGLLQCQQIYNNLKFGMQAHATVMDHFELYMSGIINCKTALVVVGSDQPDIGLVPNGAKCGENKMCIDRKCVSIDTIKNAVQNNDCQLDCSGNGICNSLGHCHCNEGFEPPFCNVSGPGGSIDSGPLMQRNRKYLELSIYLTIFIVFIIATIIFACKYRNKIHSTNLNVQFNSSSCFESNNDPHSTGNIGIKKKIEKSFIVKGALISTTNESVLNNL